MAPMHPNRAAFLKMIALSELGPDLLAISDDGYNVIVGSTAQRPLLTRNYRDHPRVKVWIRSIGDYSTAYGRYQILARMFDAYKKQLKLPDCGPDSQDRIALQMIRECRALVDIDAGRLDVGVRKCASRWASLPGAGYGQPEHKLAELEGYFTSAGGVLV